MGLIMQQVCIYLDGSVNVKGFKDLHPYCQFLLSPYDSASQKRKDVKWELATPSKGQWRDAHMSWSENRYSWETHKASEKLPEIYSIIGNDPQERRDGLHLDSAFKSGVQIFFTGDKDNIWKHRHALEPLLGFRIFYPDSEVLLVKELINTLVGKFLG
jgi:hypothetical protein